MLLPSWIFTSKECVNRYAELTLHGQLTLSTLGCRTESSYTSQLLLAKANLFPQHGQLNPATNGMEPCSLYLLHAT